MKRLAWAIPLATLLASQQADACGCFTMPNAATPVVQAGERILFAHDGNQVVAYIQIQYQGSADKFGWLVPLPSVPTLELGTDELFTKLGSTTQPQFQLTTNQIFCGGGSSSSTSSPGVGCGGQDDEAALAIPDLGMRAAADAAAQMNPVVIQSSIGPYDYAVLKADDQTEMQKWLADNGYFVPDATGDAVKPYIHTGAFFLAIKLQTGQATGDIVPIVLKYQSDLPMIPITLTQVGAVPNMGVLVWVLGEARAIPRNYYHSVLDEMTVWFNANSYQDLVIRAVREAPGRHSFLTEYAGTSSVMSNQLYYTGRFGDLNTMRAITDPTSYMNYLRSNGFTFDSTLFALLERFLPEPAQAIKDGVPESQFYSDYSYYASLYALGTVDGGAPFVFDAAGLTDAIDMRIIRPTRASQALFDEHPYLTRLYTTISPADMNLDPVFSENPDLPEVRLLHTATLTVPCQGDSWLKTDQGFEVQYQGGFAPSGLQLPPTLRLERLREAGAPEVVTDNAAAIKDQLGPVVHNTSTNYSTSSSSGGGGSSGCACDVSARTRNQLGTGVLIFAAMLWIRLRRRRAI